MEMRRKGRVANIKLYLLETAMVFISFFLVGAVVRSPCSELCHTWNALKVLLV